MNQRKNIDIRFWDDPRRDPLWNMSADTWLAEQAPLLPGEWIIRMYSWNPGAITIGRNQSFERAIDVNSLGKNEIAVRRVTGGRAIFHDSEELTYAFAHRPRSTDPDRTTLGPNEIKKISHQISAIIENYLAALGLNVSVERGSVGVRSHSVPGQAPACFSSVARHEIRADGVKVAAGAQRTIGDRYFQHGSIKLAGQTAHPALSGSSAHSANPRRATSHNSLAFKQSCSLNLCCDVSEWAPSIEEIERIDREIDRLDYRVGTGDFDGGFRSRSGLHVGSEAETAAL